MDPIPEAKKIAEWFGTPILQILQLMTIAFYIKHLRVKGRNWITEVAKFKFFSRILERKGKVLGRYRGTGYPIELECDKGHTWYDKPSHISSDDRWCPECANTVFNRARRYFIQLVESRGGKVLGEYINGQTPVEVQCGLGHRTWKPYPIHVVHRDSWCPVCVKRSVPQAREDFFTEVQNRGGIVHNPQDYRNLASRLIVQCRYGHVFNLRVGSLASSGTWCFECAHDNSWSKATQQKLIEIVTEREGMIKSQYSGTHRHIILQCKYGHPEWTVYPSSVLYCGTWCPSCRQSRGERAVSESLKLMNIEFTLEYPIIIQGRRHKFDFMIDLVINSRFVKLFIEFDGKQHFEENNFFTTPLEKQQEKDRIKNEWTTENSFHLLRIPYWEIANVPEILSNTFQWLTLYPNQLLQLTDLPFIRYELL